MATPEQIRDFATLGRELGYSGGELNSFVNARCDEAAEKMRAEERAKVREHEMKMAEMRSTNSSSSTHVDLSGLHLKIGKFDENRDRFDAYINKFELFADSQKIPTEFKALYLISNLSGKALEVVNRMEPADRDDYARVKQELMVHFQLTEEGYRRKFRTARPEKGERPHHFATRLRGYLVQWIELSGIDEEYDKLFDLVLREQFLNNCSKEVVAFLKERDCDSMEVVSKNADVYVNAHGVHTFGQQSKTSDQNQKWGGSKPSQGGVKNKPGSPKPPQRPFEVRGRNQPSQGKKTQYGAGRGDGPRGCYQCGSPTHLKRDCPMVRVKSAQAMVGTEVLTEGSEMTRSNMDASTPSAGSPGNSIGSLRSNDGGGKQPQATGQSAACMPVGNHVPVDGYQKVEKLGMAYGQVSAMMNRMPVVSGRLYPGEVPISVLRDTGCSTCVVKSRLVERHQLTGKCQTVRLIDGTVKQFPVAKVELDSPYFSGEIEALCMPDCLCEVIVGNVTGAREPNDPDLKWVPRGGKALSDDADQEDDGGRYVIGDGEQTVDTKVDGVDKEEVDNLSEVKEDDPQVMAVETRSQKEDQVLGETECSVRNDDSGVQAVMAVETRAQKARSAKPKKGLVVVDSVKVADPPEFRQKQKDDPTLRASWDKVGVTDNSRYLFRVDQGCLLRQERDPENPTEGIGPKLVVVPKEYRADIMHLAHESLFGGHLGINNTLSKVKTQFFWSGMYEDIANFCRSCDVCQKTISKGKVPKVELGRLPTIEVPFQRIAIDLMGPFTPSERGHTYILTIVDYATRYTEAIPLKSITTVDVAEALVTVYSRVGIPQEVMSDLGPQFVSDLMKEVCRLLSIKQLTSSRYHPMCNGLVERYNAVVKSSLKRLCTEEPRQWDRYLPALLFALREAPSSSLGFSPFELLYGRHVRGPMEVLRELLTNDAVEPERKSEYEYVIELRKRLVESWQMAQENLKQSAKRYKTYYDRGAKKRKLKIGDKVLVLLPTEQNKLLVKWKGPYEVVGAKYDYDYVVDVDGMKKTFHINMLKRYFSRVAEEETAGSCFEMCHDGGVDELWSDEGMENNDDVFTEIPEMPCPIQREFVEDVQLDVSLDEVKQEQIRRLLCEYQDVFTDVPKKSSIAECKIHLTTDEPVRSPPYRVPQALQGEIQKEVEMMMKLGVIEPSDSPYGHPIVMVKKPDGTNRFCIDFRRLNKVTVFDPEPMPVQQDLFASLAKSKYFSKLDLSKGYWQLPLRDSDKAKTAFLTPIGQFQFRYMPFGLVTAGAQFTKMMRKLLLGVPNVVTYIDDVLVHTNSWEEHVTTLSAVLSRLREANLAARPTKCALGFQSIEFLGHEVSEGILQTSERLTKKIAEAPRPVTKKQVRSFVGLTGYYRDFILNYADVALPLTNLTKKGSPEKVKWGEGEEQAFLGLKKSLIKPPILHLPDETKVFKLKVDASDTGLGAVLMQERDGEDFPVAYASRKLLPRECRYATIEKECLAIVWAIRKFEFYLCGRSFEVHTDHKPLTYIQAKKMHNKRIMRWCMSLQEHRFRLVSVKGKDNVAADAMSRLV
ncbi:uncharacterized protein [Diadema setosum]|uniref:uncharacterized protein n=1 Tax=Diadema setosum TaxID=31175 RepID=UPI003B3A7147